MLQRLTDEERTRWSGTFRTAFQDVAAYFGRPSTPDILFAGMLPEDVELSLEDVEEVASRSGLSVETVSLGDLLAERIDWPAVVLFADGTALSLFGVQPDGSFALKPDGAVSATGDLTASELVGRQPRAIFVFSAVYRNDSIDEAAGLAKEVERQHWLVQTLTPFWRTYLQVGLAALFINIIALASPLFTMNVYDRILPNKATSSLWVLALGVSLAFLFDYLLRTARSELIDYAGKKADNRLSHLLFDKILHTSLSHRPLSTGEYASRISQYEFVREFFTSNTISVLIDSAFAFIFLFVIYFIAGALVIIPAVALLLAVAIGLVAQHRIGKRVAAAANEAAQRQSLLVETLSTIETVKSLRAEGGLQRRWRELTKNASRTSEQIKQISSGAANATQFVQQLVTVGLIVGGAHMFAEGDITMGGIIASVMLSSRAVAPLGQIAMTLARFRQAALSLKILNAIMAQPEDRPNTIGFVNRRIESSSVAFQGVEFVYPNSNHSVLTGVTCSIKAGERVGIIGRIGSGKTSFGRMLGGLYAPSGGRVLIDGIDLQQYHSAEVRRAVAIAGQSTDLFSGTIKENLLIGNEQASDEELIAAARIAGVDEFVSRHPRGYDMPVGERGSNLSGGQKQAVTIARLMLANPKIVFLDEPSGAMDLASERLLIQRLKDAFDPSQTVILATHRYSMLELVDRLIVLDQGRIVADGPKQKVIESLQRTTAAA